MTANPHYTPFTDRITRELFDLTKEIMETTGVSREEAVVVALNTFADLLAHADEWNEEACLRGNTDACPF